MNKYIYILLFALATLTSCKIRKVDEKQGFINANDKDILYTGRIDLQNDSPAVLFWPGTTVKINFKGSDLSVILKDAHKKNYYNVILDGKILSVLNPDSVKTSYHLISGIAKGNHTLELFKRTEWNQGSTLFYGFKTGKGTKLLAPPKSSDRTIEFFGNSITAGYAIGDTINDSPDGMFTNNYLTYGALTARHYNANYYCTARGGIGVTISWFPLIMDEMYNRLDPEDASSKWNFKKVTPDIVVINLFQNDSWLVEKPDYPEFKHRFGDQKPTEEFIISKYEDFLKKIRKTYPDARIVCALGTMDGTVKGSPWPGYIKNAVEQMNDPKIYTLFFPYQEYEGHPEVRTHRKMANSLISFIDRNSLWD